MHGCVCKLWVPLHPLRQNPRPAGAQSRDAQTGRRKSCLPQGQAASSPASLGPAPTEGRGGCPVAPSSVLPVPVSCAPPHPECTRGVPPGSRPDLAWALQRAQTQQLPGIMTDNIRSPCPLCRGGCRGDSLGQAQPVQLLAPAALPNARPLLPRAQARPWPQHPGWATYAP